MTAIYHTDTWCLLKNDKETSKLKTYVLQLDNCFSSINIIYLNLKLTYSDFI